MKPIKKFMELNDKSRVKIAVAGDVMIDEHYAVDACRISPEFPIPVSLSPSTTPTSVAPGAAANVAHQFKHLHASTYLFSFYSSYARQVFSNAGIHYRSGDTIGISNGNNQVPIKRRLYKDDFPLCRWDIEQDNYGRSLDSLDKMIQSLYDEYKRIEIDAIILSDYDKGFFKSGLARKLWLSEDKIKVVDPKNGPVKNWAGCTVFKPNAVEAVKMSGLTAVDDQLSYFYDQLGCPYVVITQGGSGVTCLINGKEKHAYKPVRTVKANSVIGAGDAFVSWLTAAMAQGMDFREAVELAFDAGATYVQNKHNKPITTYDVLRQSDPLLGKYVSLKVLQDRDYKLVITNGCFDVLTVAHLELLQFAKAQGDKLVVAVNSDASVESLKGKGRPINTLEERVKALAACEFVDFVISFDDGTPYKLLKELKPETLTLVKGGDYHKTEVVGYDLVKDVQIFPYIEGVSSTNKIKSMKQAAEAYS